ncbi:ABC transporter permease [Corynebacterium suedekumii]|nr:ABC transporter permease [Corynebacterium suedekumii]
MRFRPGDPGRERVSNPGSDAVSGKQVYSQRISIPPRSKDVPVELLGLLLSRSRPYTGYVVAIVVLQTISTLATLYAASLNAEIIDGGVSRGDIDYIWNRGGIMLVVAFVQVITAVIAVVRRAHGDGGGRDVRRDIFRRVSRYSAEDMGHFGSATLITRNTNDAAGADGVPDDPQLHGGDADHGVGGIIMAMREDAGLSWLVWVSVIVLAVLVLALVGRLMPMFTAMQGKIDRINGILREQITGIRVVRAFTREEHETARFDVANRDITDISVRIGRVFVLMGPIITLILNVSTGAVLCSVASGWTPAWSRSAR